MKYLRTITAASVLAVSGFATAETTLTQNQMDGVNAGGFASADAIATALGTVTSAFTDTWTSVTATNIVPGQFGAIFVIDSDAHALAESDSAAKAFAIFTSSSRFGLAARARSNSARPPVSDIFRTLLTR